MNTSIIAVGTELLFGQTINTNAAFLSEKLNQMGFNVMYHYVVGDNPARLKELLGEAFGKTDLVILTGGLGPTQDDLTKEIVAEFMGAPLIKDDIAMRDLELFFSARNIKMSENNYKQAYLPEGCTPLYNESGTAPGFALEKDGKIAICFPGPPREMTWLWEHGAYDYLEGLADKKMYYKVIRTVGIGESDLEMVLMPLIDGQTDPTIATYAKEGECTFRVASQRDTMEEAKNAVDDMIAQIDELVGEYIYSYDNEELNSVVVNLLREKGMTIASAESATAGLFAATIAEVPGASNVMGASFVTYSNEAKNKLVDVDLKLIDEKGVVSPEVAMAMAQGARLNAGSDIGVSVTGFAGPDADEGFNPGDAFVGYSNGDETGYVTVHGLRRDRQRNRQMYVLIMLRAAYRLLTK